MTPRRTTTTLVVFVTALAASVLVLPSPAQAAYDRTSPTVPQGLRVTGSTASSVSLAWGSSYDRSGQVRYRVYVDGGWRGTAGSPANTVGNLSANTTYTFVVRAEDRYGNVSAPSSPVSGSTGSGDGGGLGKPGNLQVTGADYDSIHLSWEASSGSVQYYLIYRNGLWVNSSYGTTGSIDYLAAGSTHNIEVVARGFDNDVSAPAAVTGSTRADTGAPSVPDNLRVVTDGLGRPTGLTWDASTDDRGVGSYWLSANGDTAYNGGPGVSFYSLTDEYCTVFSGQTYTFTVRAVDLSGNLSATGQAVTVRVP